MSYEECTALRFCGKKAVAIAKVDGERQFGGGLRHYRVPVCAGCLSMAKAWDGLRELTMLVVDDDEHTPSRKFRVRVWCRDCGNGEDPLGCFDGASELLEEVYATREEAEAAGYEYTAGPPWEFEIEEATDT